MKLVKLVNPGFRTDVNSTKRRRANCDNLIIETLLPNRFNTSNVDMKERNETQLLKPCFRSILAEIHMEINSMWKLTTAHLEIR